MDRDRAVVKVEVGSKEEAAEAEKTVGERQEKLAGEKEGQKDGKRVKTLKPNSLRTRLLKLNNAKMTLLNPRCHLHALASASTTNRQKVRRNQPVARPRPQLPDLAPALQPMLDRLEAKGVNTALLQPMLGVRESYLDAALNELRIRYKTVEGYARTGLGLTSQQIDALRSRFVSTDDPFADRLSVSSHFTFNSSVNGVS